MTEQEIVDYLKNNKTEGRIFLFMPEEVREWCRKHYNNLHYYVYEDGIFESMNISNGDGICAKEIIGLPDNFKMEENLKGEWVEFEIEDSSCFAYSHTVGTRHLFDWFDWVFFLKSSEKQGWGFTAFGGWKYEGDTGWYTAPCIKAPRNTMWMYIDGESLPTIPVKIRFWREKK